VYRALAVATGKLDLVSFCLLVLLQEQPCRLRSAFLPS
jgi:hypothetical protein